MREWLFSAVQSRGQYDFLAAVFPSSTGNYYKWHIWKVKEINQAKDTHKIWMEIDEAERYVARVVFFVFVAS